MDYSKLAGEVAEYLTYPDRDNIAEAYLDLDITAAKDPQDIANEIEEAYAGRYRNDAEFAQDLADQLGSIDVNVSWPYTCIDWEQAAHEIMYDYSEKYGHYFRNI